MIVGAHSIIYSRDAEADRAFLSRVLGLSSVDAGHGWLIFGLPPSEVAVHPAARNNRHELYLLCADIHDFAVGMKELNVETSRISRQAWGYLTEVALPGGGRLGVYQPLHKRPRPVTAVRRAGHGRKTARK